MPICKKCLLHILSNLMFALIIYTLITLALQSNADVNINYWLPGFTLILIIVKSWADKTLNDLK